jgi:hypothetical protein
MPPVVLSPCPRDSETVFIEKHGVWNPLQELTTYNSLYIIVNSVVRGEIPDWGIKSTLASGCPMPMVQVLESTVEST